MISISISEWLIMTDDGDIGPDKHIRIIHQDYYRILRLIFPLPFNSHIIVHICGL